MQLYWIERAQIIQEKRYQHAQISGARPHLSLVLRYPCSHALRSMQPFPTVTGITQTLLV